MDLKYNGTRYTMDLAIFIDGPSDFTMDLAMDLEYI